jgi:hypothetical protein
VSARSPRRGERGQILPLTAVIMVAMVGMLAIALDTGFFLMTRRELQNAADAAALAGVVELPADPTAAHTIAAGYANRNTTGDTAAPGATSPPSSSYVLTDPPADASRIAGRVCEEGTLRTEVVDKTRGLTGGGYVFVLEVTVHCKVQYSFGRILNLARADVSATGIAAIGGLRSSACVIPLGVVDNNGGGSGLGYDFGDEVLLKVGTDNNSTGNFHALDLDGSGRGAAGYREWLAGKCERADVGEAKTKPGNMPGATTRGLCERGLVRTDGKSGCNGNIDELLCPVSWDTVVDTSTHLVRDGQGGSPCLALVPVLPSWNVNGSKATPISGFALFFIEQFVDGGGGDDIVVGRFVMESGPGDLGAYDGYGALAFRLIG